MKMSFLGWLFLCLALSSCAKTVVEETLPSNGTSPVPIAQAPGPTRLVPIVALDDDGELSFTKATRPAVICGLSGTVSVRTSDCAARNLSSASFDAGVNGPQGGGVWALVSRTADGNEVWQDGRTGLLWSDRLGDHSEYNNQGVFNWCLASGNTQGNSDGLECGAGVEDSFNFSAISLCAETSGLQNPAGIHTADDEMNVTAWGNSGSFISSAKSGLSKADAVAWRLPTQADWQQASRNGLRQVLPRLNTWFWSSTVSSSDRRKAFAFYGNAGILGEDERNSNLSVRCVGSVQSEFSTIQKAILAFSDFSADPTSTPAVPLRLVPDVTLDDEGAFTPEEGCDNSAGPLDSCTTFQFAPRPNVDCGSVGTIQSRVDDCAARNGSSASWDAIQKNGSGGAWQLVVHSASGKEVWRDGRTRFLWSDQVGDLSTDNNKGVFNWCLASGNTENESMDCLFGMATSYNRAGVSLCAEVAKIFTPQGTHFDIMEIGIVTWSNDGIAVSSAKGNLGLAGTPKIAWRLPTSSDWLSAHVNGARQVLPNMNNYFWSATLSSTDRAQGWVFHGRTGVIGQSLRQESNSVRCVGNEL